MIISTLDILGRRGERLSKNEFTVMIPNTMKFIAAVFLNLGLTEFGFWNEVINPMPG